MKREFLTGIKLPDGSSLPKDVIDSIMDENGKDIEAQKTIIATRDATITTLTTERDGLKTQVADRDNDIADLQKKVEGNEDLTKQLNDLRTKYDTDTKSLQDKLTEQRENHAIEKVFAGVPFASNLARKAAINDFREKGYKLRDDGTYAEAESYIDLLKKDDPGSFKVVDDGSKGKPKGEKGGEGSGAGGNTGDDSAPGYAQNAPRFTHPMGANSGAATGGDGKSSFNFRFPTVRDSGKK